MNNIEEKISALYDGELSEAEVEEVLLLIDGDPKLQKKIVKIFAYNGCYEFRNEQCSINIV